MYSGTTGGEIQVGIMLIKFRPKILDAIFTPIFTVPCIFFVWGPSDLVGKQGAQVGTKLVWGAPLDSPPLSRRMLYPCCTTAVVPKGEE